MKWIKKQLKKLAGLIVTFYYTRLYDKAAKEADKRHEEEGGMMYVIDHLYKNQTLAVINRAGFRGMKHDMQKYAKKASEWAMYFSNDYNVQLIKDGSWYHTADRSGKNGLKETEIQARKAVFIKFGLIKAKLVDAN